MHLSVIIPTHNTNCSALVNELHCQLLTLQADTVNNLDDFEIIIADDGSNDLAVQMEHVQLNALDRVHFVSLPKAVSRSAMRNRLPELASFEWQLQINANVRLADGSYVRRYVEAMNREDAPDVICGNATASAANSNLRCAYEQNFARRHPAIVRNEAPFKAFRNTNFAIRTAAAKQIRYDERILGYGYEDLVYGMSLRDAGVKLLHIDNQVLYDCTESSEQYLHKTEEALQNLLCLSPAQRSVVNVYAQLMRLKRFHLLSILRLWHKIAKKNERRNLCGTRPSMFVFKLYKLGYLTSLI